MEPKKTDTRGPDARETEKAARQDVEANPAADPDGASPNGGIPPLPEPDVEGVGEEGGPSAGEGSDRLSPDQKKMAEDGTGF